MKIYGIIGGLVAIAVVSSCAKSTKNLSGELAQREFEAWLSVNGKADWEETELGSMIISLNPGDVENQSVKDIDENPFLRLEFTVTDLEGNVSETTYEEVSKRLGKYDKRNYYGPQFSYRGSNNSFAGVEELLGRMGVGGHCKAVIPGWLLTSSRYSSKQQYLDAMTEITDAKIYDFTVVESVKDSEEWELNLIKNTLGTEWDKADSLAPGVFYIQDRASDNPDTTFSSGAEVYINYICRRIDGTGIDTNIADSAKVFGGSASGKPVLINWAESATEITMTSDKSTVITGFAYGIFHMRPHEKGRVYMTSTYGYPSGSGSQIPTYCPIYFEIEFTDNDDE
ncbi:MAG: FKBP-type peptidyl-prolyl cis-trans isomerase [Candidatus Cryptobacteroides sp.]